MPSAISTKESVSPDRTGHELIQRRRDISSSQLSMRFLTKASEINGEPVEAELCEENPPLSEVPCEMACPGDCVVSSWSDWSSCSHSCTNKNAEGRQSRMRTILALPGEGGKACPPAPALEQWRSCNDHPCIIFYWETSSWGPCTEDLAAAVNSSGYWNETSTCAVGVQTRKVTCMKTNSGPVVPKSLDCLCKEGIIYSEGLGVADISPDRVEKNIPGDINRSEVRYKTPCSAQILH
ncbi:hypothetical protein MHYP_G00062570 [Metynnis hypsauchen]